MNTHILKHIFAGILLTSVFAGCNKSEEQKKDFELKGTFILSAKMEVSPIEMYTMTGKVTDANKIKDYFIRRNLSGYFNIDHTPEPAGTGKVEFKSSDKVVYTQTMGTFSDTKEYLVTDKNSNGFTLTGVDFDWVNSPTNPTRSEMLTEYITPIKLRTGCKEVPSPTGFDKQCMSRIIMPFTIDGDKLNFKIFTCDISTHAYDTGARSGFLYFNVPGLFDSSITSRLQPGDTILVQQKLKNFSNKPG